MYSKIVVYTAAEPDDILTKQIGMLKERHHAEVVYVDNSEIAMEELEKAKNTPSEVLFISDNEDVLGRGKALGCGTNSPANMKKSYEMAMALLKNQIRT